MKNQSIYTLLIILGLLTNCKDDKQLPLPEVTSSNISQISYTTAIGGGEVISDGGVSVIARGVCWSVSPSPTIADSKTIDGQGGGSFVSSITGLSPNTAYFVRAYATNANGTSYGLSLSFTTMALTLPILTTNSVTNITSTGAISGGNITEDGGSNITTRGVCWSVNQNPTIADNKTINGSGIGSFTSNLTNMVNSGTVYYIRAYATNSVGTSYGNELATGTYDGDQNIYASVYIGSQVWLKNDLKTSKFSNGDNIPSSSWSFYDNNSQFNNPYGKLYNFQAVNDVRKLCPNGYHVPNETDWNTLINFLGGSDVAGGKMKEQGTAHWASPNVGADNSSGFTAIPGGRRSDDGSYAALTLNSIWWSSTDFPGTSNALYYSLFNSNTTIINTGINKNYQMSVRCIKD